VLRRRDTAGRALRDGLRGARRRDPPLQRGVRPPLSGPARGAHAASSFPVANRFCVALSCGRAGRLTAEHGGRRPGQSAAAPPDLPGSAARGAASWRCEAFGDRRAVIVSGAWLADAALLSERGPQNAKRIVFTSVVNQLGRNRQTQSAAVSWRDRFPSMRRAGG
jgi:hypothetical protein